jgi:hypothetical protein
MDHLSVHGRVRIRYRSAFLRLQTRRFMARSFVLAAALLVAACNPQKPPPAEEAPPVAEAPAPAPFQALTGIFTASSDTATSITGDLSVIAERVTLAKGEQFETAPAAAVPATTRIAATGKTFAETAAGVTAPTVELRKVTAASVGEGQTPQKVCGAAPVTHVAFAYDAARSSVFMLAFSGDEAPGDTAAKTTLCGTFTYTQ